MPTSAARARFDMESTPSVCSTGTSIGTVRGAALVCRCAPIGVVGSVATVGAIMPGEFPDNQVIPPVGLSSKRKRRPQVGVSNYVLAE